MNRREFIVGAAVAGASFSALGRAAVGRGVSSVAPTEVLVAGGGPAGFIAAIAAARNGAKVTLVESFGFPGGMATAGLVGPISKFNFGGKRVVGGIPVEFIDRLAACGGAIVDLPKGNVPFDVELYQRVAREMLEEAGVHCLWQTSVCGEPEIDSDGNLVAATLSTAGFLSRIEAKVFVDCTASGALVGHHGFGRLRSEKGSAQPLSLYFILGGVDTKRLKVLFRTDDERSSNPVLRKALSRAVDEGRLESFGGPWAVWGSAMRPGFVSVNATRAVGDVTDPEEVAAATAVLRRSVPVVVDVLRDAEPAFADAWLDRTATMCGFRECRELIAVHRVTAKELESGVVFPDTVAFGAHPIDRHVGNSTEQQLTFLKRPYAIPFSALVSAKCPNLLAAGGLVAAEPQAFASMRVQAQCMAMGEAVGTAAAMCARTRIKPRDLDVSGLIAKLRSQKVYLG